MSHNDEHDEHDEVPEPPKRLEIKSQSFTFNGGPLDGTTAGIDSGQDIDCVTFTIRQSVTRLDDRRNTVVLREHCYVQYCSTQSENDPHLCSTYIHCEVVERTVVEKNIFALIEDS